MPSKLYSTETQLTKLRHESLDFRGNCLGNLMVWTVSRLQGSQMHFARVRVRFLIQIEPSTHTHTHTHTQAHTSTHVFVSVCIHSMLLCQITQGGAGLVGACKGRERVALAVAAGTHAVVRTRERLQRQAFLPPLSLSRTNRVRAIPPPRGSLRPCSTHVCQKRPSIKKCQKRQYGVVSKESKSGSERGLVQYKKRPTVRGIPERRGRALQAHGAAHFW